MSENLTSNAWRWRSTTVILVVLAGCTAITARITDPHGGWSGLVNAAGVVSYPALLAAFLILDIRGRVSVNDLSPWLAVGIALVATQGLLLTLETWQAPACCPPGWPLLADAVLAVLLLAIACLATVPVLVNPGLASLAGGFGLAALHLVFGTPGPELGGTLHWAIVGLVATSGLLVAARLVRLTALPVPAARALAVVVVLLVGQRLVLDALPAGQPVLDAIAVVSVLTGAAVACGVFTELLRGDVLRARWRELMVSAELDALRGEVHDHRERLHEVRATIASILSAADLLAQEPDGDERQRQQLLALLHPETARLHRLLEARAADREPFDLDEVVETAVLAHRATGQRVDWTPSHAWVVARRDDVAQVVRVLLDNAAVHAPGALVSVTSTTRDGWVELVVADRGPGVPASLRTRIFDHEFRRTDSPGSGLGLTIAKRLVTASHGYLWVARRGHDGAAFVVGLPELGRRREIG